MELIFVGKNWLAAKHSVVDVAAEVVTTDAEGGRKVSGDEVNFNSTAFACIAAAISFDAVASRSIEKTFHRYSIDDNWGGFLNTVNEFWYRCDTN